MGVSSHQFDVAERGFSTRLEGELDLRMDRRQELTAKDIVNSADVEELTRLLRLYGELPNAYQMAKAIVAARALKAIETTFDLREAVSHHLPRGMENKYLAMLFQALRIEVNGELEALKAMLQQAVELLNPGGRLVVMSYHSLEDKMVSHVFHEMCQGCICPPDLPVCVCGHEPSVKIVTRKPIVPAEEERETNPRASSAKLRVAEKR